MSTKRNHVRTLDVLLPDAPAEQPAEILRVLLVDNEAEGAGQTLQAALERAGYEVVVASSADVALTMLDHGTDYHAAVVQDDFDRGRARQLVQTLMDRRPPCRTIMMAPVSAQLSPSDLARSGAHMYLRRPKTVPEILDAVTRTVRSSMDWRNALNPNPIATRGRGRSSGDAPQPVHFELQRAVTRLRYIANLSPAETMAAWRLLWGDSNKRISELLGCTERTVKFHVAEVLARTGARSRAGLLRVLLEDSGIRDPWEHRGTIEPRDIDGDE